MNEPNEHHEEKQEPAILGVIGERLCQARKAQGLSIEDVAIQMHLRVNLIQALEAGNEDQLPPMNFVTGYLRSYARLLNLPAEELLASLPSEAMEPPPIVATSKTRVQASSRDLPMRLVTYLIIVILSALLVLWWFNRREDIAKPPPPVAETVEQDSSLALPLPGRVEEGGIGSTEQEPSTVAEVVSPVAEQPEQPEREPVAEPSSSETMPEEVPAVEEETATSVPLEPDLQGLQLVFKQDSWVEIKDATGKKVLFGLYKEGRDINTKGMAPFEVLLGYAPGVELFYNGEPFDHSRYHREGVARFTLGQSDQETP